MWMPGAPIFICWVSVAGSGVSVCCVCPSTSFDIIWLPLSSVFFFCIGSSWTFFAPDQQHWLEKSFLGGIFRVNSSAFVRGKGAVSACSFTSSSSPQFYSPVLPLPFPALHIDQQGGLFLTEGIGEEFPVARLLRPMEVELGPGDVLFVPAGMPHFVEGLGDAYSIAISGNFLDTTNLQ